MYQISMQMYSYPRQPRPPNKNITIIVGLTCMYLFLKKR